MFKFTFLMRFGGKKPFSCYFFEYFFCSFPSFSPFPSTLTLMVLMVSNIALRLSLLLLWLFALVDMLDIPYPFIMLFLSFLSSPIPVHGSWWFFSASSILLLIPHGDIFTSVITIFNSFYVAFLKHSACLFACCVQWHITIIASFTSLSMIVIIALDLLITSSLP